jgi:hypothetical protein
MIQEKNTLPPSLILILRFVWLILLNTLTAVFIAGISPRFSELTEICQVEPCLPLILQGAEAQALDGLGLPISAYAIYHITIEIIIGLACGLLAILMFWQRFDEPMGILVSFMLILFGLNFMVETDSAFYHLHPDFLPVQNTLSGLAIIPLVLLIFLFPNGRFVPRWNRFVVLVITLVALLDPLILKIAPPAPSGQFSMVLTITTLTGVLIGVGSQIYRFRSISKPAQKQQTKWVLVGFLSLLVPLVGWTMLFEILSLPSGMPRLIVYTLVYGVMAIFLFFFPLSFVIAIMRYRLWDIDLLIRRTLVYSILTGTLVMVYFGSVVVVQTAVNGLTGQEQSSQLTIALSTLLIAALFNPARKRVQSLVDRRFYRQKYDAAQTLAAFASSVQDEVEIGQLQQALAQVVTDTLQPTYLSLWIKSEKAEKEST